MDQKDEVKSKVDIVEVISSYLPLKKMGRNYGGLCPFHSEKTPSFMVSAERQVFKCFGCGEGGDVFTFLEKMEGWDFREALEEMASRVGVKLVKFSAGGKSQEKEKLIAVNTLAGKFYAHVLNNHPAGARARDYLKGRKIHEDIWKKFGLGFAPSGWENTFKFLTKKGFSSAEVAQAGLIISRQKGSDHSFYDRFRDRLMFPLKDSRGTILGFAGRLIGTRDTRHGTSEAKYVNSPETPIFNKGSLLFGLDIARSAIRDRGEAVLVEGEFDVMSAYQAGVENVVASKGTALTSQQVLMLSRICENVALCFDGDIAGDAAARRGIELLDSVGLSIKVVGLGKYKDPDEFATGDAPAFKKSIEKAANVYDYLIESAVRRNNPTTAQGKKKIGEEIIPTLTKITDDLVRAHYIEKLAHVLELDVSLVSSAVEKKVDRTLTYEEVVVDDVKKTQTDVEKYFLALCLFGDEISSQVLKFLEPSDFEDKDAGGFWKALRDIIKISKVARLKKVLGKLPTKFSKLVDDLYLVNISPTFSERELWAAELVKIAERVKAAAIKRKLVHISEEIKQAEVRNDPKHLAILTKRFDDMSKSLKEVSI